MKTELSTKNRPLITKFQNQVNYLKIFVVVLGYSCSKRLFYLVLEENGAPPVVNGFQSPQNNDSGVDLAAQAEEPVVPPAPQQNGDNHGNEWIYVSNSGRGNSPASSIHSSQFSQQEEPESIKKWREEHLKAIKAKGE